MKTLPTIAAVMAVLALTSGSVFSGEHGRRIGEAYEQPNGYISKIYGTVEKLPAQGLSGTWVINGREIIVTKDTVLKEEYGKVEVGAYVEIKGTQSGETFSAYKIEVKRAKETTAASREDKGKIYGTVERLPEGLLGTWIVSGKEVFVSKDTFIKEKYGKVAVGVAVEVKGGYSGKTFTAYEIEIKSAEK